MLTRNGRPRRPSPSEERKGGREIEGERGRDGERGRLGGEVSQPTSTLSRPFKRRKCSPPSHESSRRRNYPQSFPSPGFQSSFPHSQSSNPISSNVHCLSLSPPHSIPRVFVQPQPTTPLHNHPTHFSSTNHAAAQSRTSPLRNSPIYYNNGIQSFSTSPAPPSVRAISNGTDTVPLQSIISARPAPHPPTTPPPADLTAALSLNPASGHFARPNRSAPSQTLTASVHFTSPVHFAPQTQQTHPSPIFHRSVPNALTMTPSELLEECYRMGYPRPTTELRPPETPVGHGATRVYRAPTQVSFSF